MTHIEKLVLRGIRSFNPNTPSTIEFQSPLTLIVGPNGSGKTTIIEALKYVTTGNLPPNTKGGAFIYDPKLAKEVEIKAQIKLKFYNTRNQLMVCTRSLQLTQKKTKVEQKTLESVLWMLNDKGEQVSISGRCAEIDKEMPHHMGVSAAVLENVIFCHQEESTWPLGEPGVVKKKMDDIFESTTYAKALGALKTLKRDQGIELKMKKQALEFLLQQRVRKEALEGKIGDSEKSFTKIEERILHMDIEAERHGADQSKVDREIKELEATVSEMIEMRIEIQSLRLYINSFSSPVIPEEEARDLERIDVGALDREIAESKEVADTHQKKLDAKIAEREAYLGMQSDQRTSELWIVEDRKKLSSVIADYKACMSRYELFLSTYSHGADNKENLANGTNNRTPVSRVGIEGHAGIDVFSEEVLRRDVDVVLKEMESRMRDLQDTKKCILDSIQMCTSSRDRNDVEIQHLAGSLVDVDEIDLTTTVDEDALARNLKQLKDRGLDTNMRECESDLMDKQAALNSMFGAVETSIRNEISVQRSAEIRSVLEKEYADLRIQGEFDVEHFERASRCVTKEVEDLRTDTRLREKDIYMRQALALREEGKVDLYKKRIALQLDKIRVICSANNLSNTLDLENTCDTNELLREIDAAKDSITSSTNAQLIYKNLQKLGIKSAGCPICKKPFFGSEKTEFVGRMENVITAIPDTVNSNMHKKEALAKEVAKIEETNAARERKNNEVCRLNEYIQEVKKIVAFGDLDAFLSEEDRLPDFVPLCGRLQELEGLCAQLSRIERGAGLVKELNSLKTDGARDSGEIDRLRNDVAALHDRLRGLKAQDDRNSREIEDLEEKLLIVRRCKESRARHDTNSATVEKIKVLRTSNEDLALVIRSYEERLKLTGDKISKIEGLSSTAWQESFKIFTTLGSLRSEYVTLSARIRDLEAKLGGAYSACPVTSECIDALRSVVLSMWDVYYIRKEALGHKKARMHDLAENLKLRTSRERMESLGKKYDESVIKERDVLKARFRDLDLKRQEEQNVRSVLLGEKTQLGEMRRQLRAELETAFRDFDASHSRAFAEVRVLETALGDIDASISAIDKSIVDFHSQRLEGINLLLRDLWTSTYKGNDIDYIELHADTTDSRSYNYRINMIKNGCEMDMRSRSSAGQKVIASILVRLALSEAFTTSCSLLALDEPTTNLDQENIESLAMTLASLIERKRDNSKFQLVVITHDEHFVKLLCGDNCEVYYKLRRNARGDSIIETQTA